MQSGRHSSFILCGGPDVSQKPPRCLCVPSPESRAGVTAGQGQWGLSKPQDILQHLAFCKRKEALFIVRETLAISLSLNAKYFIGLLCWQIISSIVPWDIQPILWVSAFFTRCSIFTGLGDNFKDLPWSRIVVFLICFSGEKCSVFPF